MNSSVSSGSSPVFEQKVRRASTMTVSWDEKVLWPGILSLYQGLSQSRSDIDWYIGWYFVYRVAIVLPIVYLEDWQYL